MDCVYSPAVESMLHGLNGDMRRKADQRLLHHFINFAHPHLPVGHDAVWTQAIPSLALEVRH